MSSIQVDPFYWDLRNKLIAPERNLLVSHYFLDRWAPVLQPDYVGLVLQLRRLAAASTERGAVEVMQDDLATRLGISRRTLQRLIAPDRFTAPKTWFLALFLRVEHRWAPTKKGQRLPSLYRIAVDDPLHPEDENSLLPQLAPREIEDLLHQGIEPLPIPPPVADDDLVQRLRAELPALANAAVQKLLLEVGADVMRQQLEWLPHRNISWAERGPAAAYAYYCRNNEPEPEALQRQARQAEHQKEYAAARATAQAEAAVAPPSDPRLLSFLDHLPAFQRNTFGAHLELQVDGTTVRLSCEPGFARLLRPHIHHFHQAAKKEFGPTTQLELQPQEAQ